MNPRISSVVGCLVFSLFAVPMLAVIAVSDRNALWPGGIVPYVIDPEFSHPPSLDAIEKAIRHWNENTVIRLVERTDQPNWVRFVPDEDGSCRANLGMVGGEQKVWLKKYCYLGVVIHEIGHAVGLWHEQQRNDRDPHVWVSPRLNIRRTLRTTFEQPGGRELAIGPYDYGSVMHYSFTGNTLNTIPPGIPHGSNYGLSAGDIDGVSRLYGRIPTRTTVTTNPEGLMIEVDGETYSRGAVHETASDLHDTDLMDKRTLRKFNELFLTSVCSLPPDQIRVIRERGRVSQAVFALYLNV